MRDWPSTDDLRESPIVLIAEHLIGKGYDLKIHDSAIETSMMTGANREYINQHIPHLSSRMVRSHDELIEHSDVLLITRDGDRLMDRIVALDKHPTIVDLRGQTHFLERQIEARRRSKGPAALAFQALPQNITCLLTAVPA